MSSVDRIIDAIKEYLDRVISTKTCTAYLGTWLAAEGVDVNLSQVEVSGTVYRYVPKLESVTGLVAGDKVLIVRHVGLPAYIHGVPLGDVTAAG